jgi:hypothetical protein
VNPPDEPWYDTIWDAPGCVWLLVLGCLLAAAVGGCDCHCEHRIQIESRPTATPPGPPCTAPVSPTGVG